MDVEKLPLAGGFHFTLSQILASLVFSVIGIYAFRHGKKTLNYGVIFTSIGLMTYGFVTHGPLQDWGVGVILCGLAYYFEKNHNLTS